LKVGSTENKVHVRKRSDNNKFCSLAFQIVDLTLTPANWFSLPRLFISGQFEKKATRFTIRGHGQQKQRGAFKPPHGHPRPQRTQGHQAKSYAGDKSPRLVRPAPTSRRAENALRLKNTT